MRVLRDGAGGVVARNGIEQLIIVGVATHNSVESTARTAGNLGFDAWVAEDACFTFDKADFSAPRSAEEVHGMSLGNLHGEYATVVNAAQILSGRLKTCGSWLASEAVRMTKRVALIASKPTPQRKCV
jgi:isochorismate hydrolase